MGSGVIFNIVISSFQALPSAWLGLGTETALIENNYHRVSE